MATKPDTKTDATKPAAADTAPAKAEVIRDADGKPVSPSLQPYVEKSVDSTVEPAKAVHHVIYGNKQSALPGQMFRPISAKERKDLFDAEAVVELDEGEKLVFEKTETSGDDVIG